MAKKNDLTAYALEGFRAEPPFENPYIPSSDAWGAWAAGRWLRTHHGEFMPVCDARKGRGHCWWVSGVRFVVDDDGRARSIVGTNDGRA